MKEKKQGKSPSAFGRLMEYAGRFKALTYLSLILSALSSILALLPFVCIWRILREVLKVQPDYFLLFIDPFRNVLTDGHAAVKQSFTIRHPAENTESSRFLFLRKIRMKQHRLSVWKQPCFWIYNRREICYNS